MFIGRDYALQNDIDQKREKTKSRSCYKECRTCGTCANSKRDNFSLQPIVYEDGTWQVKPATVSYDSSEDKWVDCRKCESYRFHDCQNGFLRNTRGEAEPFTDDMYTLMKKSGGKPLI